MIQAKYGETIEETVQLVKEYGSNLFNEDMDTQMSIIYDLLAANRADLAFPIFEETYEAWSSLIDHLLKKGCFNE